KPGNVFIDVGAHVGKYSFYASKQVRDSGLVIAIEPHPKNVENLKKGMKLNGLTNIVVVEKACGNYSGKGFLTEHGTSANYKLVQKPTEIKVEVDTLDDILESLHVRRVDMMKIDVEGCEHEVLQGAYKTIKEFKPLLMVEVILNNKQKIFQYLQELGYHPAPLCKKERYWDVLFNFH
ncbi:MAG: FkbM family methyltransferase, partial [Thermoproteota archaeon]|nr:FkbM family methyltransferase [Thermoproteota archaeon]